jgi:hypothetical protein
MVTIPSTQVRQHVRIGQCVTPASDGRQQQEVATEEFACSVDFIDDGLGLAVMPNHALQRTVSPLCAQPFRIIHRLLSAHAAPPRPSLSLGR